jgi:hypothetical protein
LLLSTHEERLFEHTRSADILCIHIDFLRTDIDYPMKDKTLVFFIENPTNDPAIWKSLPSLLEGLKPKWGEIFITGPVDNRTREIVESIFPQRNFFPITLSYTCHFYQKKNRVLLQ